MKHTKKGTRALFVFMLALLTRNAHGACFPFVKRVFENIRTGCALGTPTPEEVEKEKQKIMRKLDKPSHKKQIEKEAQSN